MAITIKVNGTQHSVDVDGDTPLLWVLRDTLGLTGTKFGCGVAQCGACTVFLDGKPLRSCALPVSALGDGEITTIEGVAGREAEAVQTAWVARDVPQCGYCQSGQVMSAIALLRGEAADRPRHRSRDERQHLPLRHLRAHPRRHQRRRAHAGGLSHDISTTQLTRRAAAQGHGRPRHRPPSAVGCRAGAVRRRAGFHARNRRAGFAPNAFVRIGTDDTVTVLIKHIEFGQGPFTGLATLVAEELDADWSKVRAEHAPSNPELYKNLAFGVQGTGGSTAIANSYEQMRKAGATARAMLVQAAAQAWRVPAGEITVERGVLRHADRAAGSLRRSSPQPRRSCPCRRTCR